MLGVYNILHFFVYFDCDYVSAIGTIGKSPLPLGFAAVGVSLQHTGDQRLQLSGNSLYRVLYLCFFLHLFFYSIRGAYKKGPFKLVFFWPFRFYIFNLPKLTKPAMWSLLMASRFYFSAWYISASGALIGYQLDVAIAVAVASFSF